MSINKKSKGFTLVELLVVIVVLALMALAASQGIFGALSTAKERTFRTDVTEAIKSAYSSYTLVYLGGTVDQAASTAKEVTYNVSTTGRYYCATLKYLKAQGQYDKDLDQEGNKFEGYIEIFVDSAGKVTQLATVQNAEYGFNRVASDNVDSQDALGVKISGGVTCPTSWTAPSK